MNRKILPLFISAAIVALIFVGCKPTENNYRKAYDAAIAKREAAAAEQMRPATGLLSDEGPQLRVMDGDSIYILKETIRNDDGSRLSGKWAVAVGRYKMDTNAKASASDMKAKGFPNAKTVKSVGGNHYVLTTTVESLDSARVAAKVFQMSMPQYYYVGLPGSPLLINY